MLIFTCFLNVKNFETSPFFSEANSYKYHSVLNCVVCLFIYCIIMYYMSRKKKRIQRKFIKTQFSPISQ